MADEENTTETNGTGNVSSVLDALKTKELLLPAALSAVGAVAVAKGPDLVRRLTETTEQKGEESAERLGRKAVEGAKSGLKESGGGLGGLGKVASKVLPGGGGGGGGGGKKTRRLPIQRWTDVAVPVEKAYEEWTKFDQFPKFMHRVLSVEEKERDKLSWQEKIWFSKRQWEGRITERRKNDRIVWKTEQGMNHKGIVSFHRLDDNLTRVMVEMDFEPNGMIEKMASGLRFVKRAVQADLARFKAHVEMADAKGLDYSVARDQKDDDKDDKKDDKQGDRNADRSSKSDDERENDRSERETRRRERQSTGSTSS